MRMPDDTFELSTLKAVSGGAEVHWETPSGHSLPMNVSSSKEPDTLQDDLACPATPSPRQAVSLRGGGTPSAPTRMKCATTEGTEPPCARAHATSGRSCSWVRCFRLLQSCALMTSQRRDAGRHETRDTAGGIDDDRRADRS